MTFQVEVVLTGRRLGISVTPNRPLLIEGSLIASH